MGNASSAEWNIYRAWWIQMPSFFGGGDGQRIYLLNRCQTIYGNNTVGLSLLAIRKVARDKPPLLAAKGLLGWMAVCWLLLLELDWLFLLPVPKFYNQLSLNFLILYAHHEYLGSVFYSVNKLIIIHSGNYCREVLPLAPNFYRFSCPGRQHPCVDIWLKIVRTSFENLTLNRQSIVPSSLSSFCSFIFEWPTKPLCQMPIPKNGQPQISSSWESVLADFSTHPLQTAAEAPTNVS